MQLTILKKGMLLVSVPLIFQLVFIALVAEMQRTNNEAQAWFAHTKEVLGQSETVLKNLIEAEGSSRGFVITLNPMFRSQFEEARREVLASLQQLRSTVADNPTQQAAIDGILTKVETFLVWHVGQQQAAADGDMEDAIGRIKSLKGKRQRDAIKADLGAFVARENLLDTQRQQAVRRSTQRSSYLLFGGTAVAILSTIALGVVFNRGIRGRLAVLTANAQRLARGERLAAPIEGSDEIFRLDQVFHEMSAELARSSEALRKQTRILESVLENLGDGVVVADSTGNFVIFNPAARQILGRGPTDTGAADWPEQFGLFLPDKKTRMPAEQIPLVLALAGEPTTGVEIFIKHAEKPAGAWISVTGRPLRDEAGAVSGGVVVFSDSTVRKQAEEAIRQTNEELEQRVAQRTIELSEVNRDLLQKNQENEMFVYSVSHDLRSPLVNLQGFSKELAAVCEEIKVVFDDGRVPDEIRRSGQALLEADMRRSITFIQTAVMRLSSIIDALLRLSRCGRIEYQPQALDVQSLVNRAVAALSGTIFDRSAELSVAPLPPVWGDQTAIEQVFANLIGNALNYLDARRPGRIEVGVLDPAADPVHTAAGQQTVYFVKDNGLGIPAAYLPKVFQAFKRLHPDVAKGEGMGLAIVRRIVERHGGRVWVESTVNEGSTFFVALPVQPAGAQASRIVRPEYERSLDDALGTVSNPVGGR